MASDKRTVLSTKKARDRRQRAARRASKKNASATPECDPIDAIATATPVAAMGHGIPTTMTVHLKLSDSSSGEEECDSSSESNSSARRTLASSGEEAYARAAGEEDDYEDDDDDDDDELVFVCRPTMPDFCTQYVPTSQELAAFHVNNNSNLPNGYVDYNKFTAKIPAFRETRDGFITYTITLSTCLEPRKHFQFERRFSEFVTFAAALNAELLAAAEHTERHQLEQDEEQQQQDTREQDTATTHTSSAFQWELPPKTWFKVTHVTALEERRNKLAQCLETLLSQESGAMCRRPLVRDFLMLDIFGAQVAEEKLQST
uniref:PX domain-containing protein n=1 Tax=Globisporangium ultimum (strain ATCC 200006 / CBS 805.95 / DAOM BR144) TaxID=431595 RepID=K3XAP1_GLOUD